MRKIRVGDIIISNVSHTGIVTKGRKYKALRIDDNKYDGPQIWVACDDGIERHGSRSTFRLERGTLNKLTKVI